MPLWPFKRRRHSTTQDIAQPLSEKTQQSGLSSPPIIASARPASQVSKDVRNRDSQQNQQPRSPTAIIEKEAELVDAEWAEKISQPELAVEDVGQLDLGKENRPTSRTWQSREDITALPMSGPLESSPHLRPVDLEKPPIPYNFRTLAGSQSSFQRQDSVKKTSRPGTLRSKRSTTDYSAPQRKRSSKIKNDPVREEEIRAMSAAVDIPKRGGDTPLRRDSKRVRGLVGKRDSTVSLPPEGSIHSSMSGLLEQRGWEVGALAIFNPRPNVRLAELPRYVSPTSGPPSSAGVLYRIDSIRAKDKRPVTRGSGKTGKSGKKQRERIGDKADSLASSDLRAIMEREAKRKEQKQKERQDKIDRKLKARPTRDRKDSERQRVAESRARAEAKLAERRSLAPLTPPTDIHPAFRIPSNDAEGGDGLGFHPSSPQSIEPILSKSAQAAPEHPDPEPVSPIDESNPFADPRTSYGQEHEVSPIEDTFPDTPGAEEAVVVDVARAIRVRTANTPPLSPVTTRIIRQPSKASLPATPTTPIERQQSAAASARKFPFASIFRRGSTNPRTKESATDNTSFSNASRESMKAQPLPSHLLESDSRRPSASQSISGTNLPTQSRFREDLPETPTSLQEQMARSPQVGIAATASLRRAAKPESIDIKAAGSSPVSPATSTKRGHLMSASLASVDSEGSWLASGSQKQRSTTSALSRSYSKRNADFTASYEDLGSSSGDKDAEYFQTMRGAQRSRVGGTLLSGATPDEELELGADDETPLADPLTIHGSMSRQPLVVHRDLRIRSREGLLSEPSPNRQSPASTSQELSPPEHDTYPESTSASEYFDADSEQHSDTDNPFAEEESPSPTEEVELQSATSVRYASRHSRQFSAGSARLLDVAPRRVSLDASTDLIETPRVVRPSSSPKQFGRTGTL